MQRLVFIITFILGIVYSDVIFQPVMNTPIFAENLGTTSLYHRTWKLIIGVDTSSIESRLEQIRTSYSKATELCNHCAEEFEINILNNRILRVTDLQTTLQQILGFSRTKRGLLNIIGTISKTLFGTLDEHDMDIIDKEFDKVYSDRKIITETIGNQTRIIKTLLNTASHDLQLLNKESGSLIEQLNQLANSTNANARNMIIANILSICTIAVSEYSEDINLIINAINDGKHGIVHPQILTPNMLIGELQRIEEDTNSKYPIKLIPQNYQHIIDISEITVSIVHKNLIYILKVPELEEPTLQTLHLLPIPIRHGTGFIAPIPSHEIILINQERTFFVPSDTTTLKNCKTLEDTYICKRLQPSFLISEVENCETSIVKHRYKTISDKVCDFSVFKISEMAFIPLHDPNQFLIIPEHEMELNALCDTKNQIITIKEPSLIHSNSNCILHTPKSILKLHNSIEHKFDIKFKKNLSFSISQTDLDLLSHQLPIIQESIHREKFNSLKRSIDTMEVSIQSIKNIRRTKSWVEKSTDILTYLGYTSLAAVTMYLLYKSGICKLFSKLLPKNLCINLLCVKNNVTTTPTVHYTSAPTAPLQLDEHLKIVPQKIRFRP
ncbi:uncharacterized protein LOC122509439 [Leptopilina heterotoma]|uniref:uncharacterized protein LOC122509439 n=1 Tax=Leptopilina heterotoma TaxID=63436 RepID=UPI001CA7EDBA|nr:uncharacterized protein LOC122509439 [Leptopilina heterotoma]